ncbi:MAG TPA: hypothetical protein VNH11_27425 [Pirellulales bacterium]|nr:hypothetical protein [Pirellulales bacterium]
MCRTLFLVGLTTVACIVAAQHARAQDGPRPGTLKKIDREKGTVTIAFADKEQEFKIAEQTRLMDAEFKPIAARLSDERLKPGTAIMFRRLDSDPNTLLGLKLGGPAGRPGNASAGGQARPVAKVDTSAFKPLPELGRDEYHGFQGGLYPDGKNDRPADHEAAGLNLASRVQPLDEEGKPDANGRIVLLTVGMSNTAQASEAFKRLADGDPQKNPQLVIVNGAQGGMTADRIADPDDGGAGQKYWSTVDERLKAAGVSRAQVQAVWIKQAEAAPNQGFPKYAEKLQRDLARNVRILPERFPNVKLCYLSPRTYGGYAKTPLNPEPYAYESGFSVKWLIERQLGGEADLNFDLARGPVKAPWLSWGAYLWANGTKANADGLSYAEADFAQDGTHESPSGQPKVGGQLLKFFKSDSTTTPWFLR